MMNHSRRQASVRLLALCLGTSAALIAPSAALGADIKQLSDLAGQASEHRLAHQVDRARAWPGYIYLLIAPETGSASGFSAWINPQRTMRGMGVLLECWRTRQLYNAAMRFHREGWEDGRQAMQNSKFKMQT